ncbi:MAG: hypothetical protein IJW48_04155 [Clostridia bacterium]|nr:hypothetical protein [Clostridia bacterium]
MKKLLALSLALILIFCSTSCDLSEHKHTKSGWKYTETEHWRVLECNRDNCVLEQEAYDLGNHNDENSDNICDVCGYEIFPDSLNVAQIVIDYENNLKSEIDKLHSEHPEYRYYYHPVDGVHCTYILDSNASADDIVAKYDMSGVFNSASVSALNAIKMVSIIFDRNDFTEEIHQKLKQINEEEVLIKNLFIDMQRDWVKSYIPKIEYYTDYHEVLSYEITSGFMQLEENGFIIKSKAEYDSYFDGLLKAAEYENVKERIEEQKDLYNADFFEENSLIITNTITRPSCSIRLRVDNLYISGNKVYVVVRTDIPGIGDAAMQHTHFTFAVPKDEVVNVNEVITLE